MNYRLLGRSGLRVSDLCLGTMTFGDWGWGIAEQEAKVIYDAYREAGGNFIDTANLYTQGTSEMYLGEFMKGHREEVVLATKYTNSMPGRDPNAGGNQRKNMVQAVEASLRRLKTDYIDLYWLHSWDQMTPVDEVMRAFDDLVRSGKVLYIGISDSPAWVLAKSNTLAELRGWTQYIGLQIEYSLLERTVERELIPAALDQRMTVLAWSPLRGGLLTGKYLTQSEESKQGRLNDAAMRDFAKVDAHGDTTVRQTVAIAQELGVTPAQVAIAWLRQRPVPVIPIIGARKLPQLEENLKSLELTLRSYHLALLDSVSAVPMGFPHDFLEKPMVKAFSTAGMGERIRH